MNRSNTDARLQQIRDERWFTEHRPLDTLSKYGTIRDKARGMHTCHHKIEGFGHHGLCYTDACSSSSWSSGVTLARIGTWALLAIDSVSWSCFVGDPDSWWLSVFRSSVLFGCVASSGPLASDGNLGSDFLWGFFAEFDGVTFFAPFWVAFSSRLVRIGWLGVVLSSASSPDLFLERPSFGDLALVGGIYNK